uniref:Uncharacterized protein n=1 Tax=Arundo donax TaxID=35708 RepID=A0A0A9D2P7_ARUDO
MKHGCQSNLEVNWINVDDRILKHQLINRETKVQDLQCSQTSLQHRCSWWLSNVAPQNLAWIT